MQLPLKPSKAFYMSVAKYTAIHHTQPFVMEVPPTPLTFGPNDSAAVREDKKLLYYNKVYNFELEKDLTTALKNIIMNKLDESAYILLKEQYVGYAGCSVWEFINHLLITYGEKTDDTVKANLAALIEEFDCTGASLEALFIRQDKIQRFAIGTSGAITDATWMLQTTHVIESSGILNKAVLKWQG